MWTRFLLWLMPKRWKYDVMMLIQDYGDAAREFGVSQHNNGKTEYKKYCDAWDSVTAKIGF